nr:hypothetical protein [Tanacetum cinerariifolium]
LNGAGLYWEVMEGRGGVVRRWWSGAEMGRSGAVESGGKKGERKPIKGQNRIKTGQKREACRSREKFKAVKAGRGRKTERKKNGRKCKYSQKLFKFKK